MEFDNFQSFLLTGVFILRITKKSVNLAMTSGEP